MKLGTSGHWVGTQTEADASHHHTSVKLFWSQPMAPWTSAATCECALYLCGSDTSSWLGSYATAACPEFHVGCRLGRELFTLPLAADHVHGAIRLRPRKLYISVAVTLAPVRVPTQWQLVASCRL